MRPMKATLAALSVVTATLVPLAPASAETSYPVVPAEPGRVNVRNGPTLRHDVIGHLDASDRVTIACTARGTYVTGSLGSSDWWNRIAGEEERWIADQFVRTGSDQPVAPLCSFVPPAPTTPAPDLAEPYRAAFDRAFGPVPEGSSRVELPAPTGPYPGLVVARFFIPAREAAAGLLEGDGRGYSDDPAASARMILTWDQRAGRATFTVTPSRWAAGGDPRSALPLQRLDWSEDVLAQAEEFRTSNYYHWDYQNHLPGGRAGSNLELTVSAVNSITATQAWGNLSVDGTLRITSSGGPGEHHVEWTGNGYPAMEVLYYPADPSETVRVVARRNITPAAFRGLTGTRDGGAAAFDQQSWAFCSSQPHQMTCTESGAFAGDGVPQWMTRW